MELHFFIYTFFQKKNQIYFDPHKMLDFKKEYIYIYIFGPPLKKCFRTLLLFFLTTNKKSLYIFVTSHNFFKTPPPQKKVVNPLKKHLNKCHALVKIFSVSCLRDFYYEYKKTSKYSYFSHWRLNKNLHPFPFVMLNGAAPIIATWEI